MTRNYQKVLNDTLFITTNNHKFEVQAYFIDLDGTLLDQEIRKKMSKLNLETVKERNKHFPVVISTGRSYNKKVINLMKILDTQYVICQNGSIIADKEGNILLDIRLKTEQIKQIIPIIKKYRFGFTINSQYKLCSFSKRFFLWKLIFWHKLKRAETFDVNSEHVNKIVIGGTLRRKKLFKVLDEIKATVPNISAKVSGNDYIIEITDKNATKGTGAQFVANILKVDVKKTIHIGDSQNDATTIGIVGALIAMKNASKKLLEVATHVGPNNTRSGLAKILNGDFKEIKR